MIYLSKFTSEEFLSIFKNSDLPIEILMKVVESILKISENDLSIELIEKVIGNLKQCSKFDFCMKCLSRSEKKEL